MASFSLVSPTVRVSALLNRAAAERKSAAWVAAQRASADARFMVLGDLKLAIAAAPDRAAGIRWFTLAEVEALPGETAFLGLTEHGEPRFCMFADPAEALKPLVDLRSLAAQGALTPDDLSLAAQARAIGAWRRTARCCGRCGANTMLIEGGWLTECGACGLQVYPRCDPAVIMLITNGERCLIGHEVRFPEKFYSVLAGFLEPGDDIEHAVRRETFEETGVRVGRVAYLASQPWPFAHSLMIGCWAEALSAELRLDPAELTDARWVSRDQVAAMLEGRDPDGITLPGPMSMAHTLLRTFIEDAAVKHIFKGVHDV